MYIRNNKGMTLLEIMIVLAIIGGLLAVLSSTVLSRLKKAKISQAKIQMSEIGKSLDMFYTDCGFYPSPDQGLQALVQAPESCTNWGPDPYLKDAPKDPWNNEFIYEGGGGSYTLITLGADNREGGEGENSDISSDDL